MPDDYQPTQFEQVLDRDMELVFHESARENLPTIGEKNSPE